MNLPTETTHPLSDNKIQHYLPALAAGTAGTLGGAMVVATRYVVTEVDPTSLSILRYGLATACLVPAAWLFASGRIPWRDVGPIGFLGLLYFTFYPIVFAASLQFTTAARGALILSTTPMATLLIGMLLRREPVTLYKAAGVSLTVAGVAMALGESLLYTGKNSLLGDAIMGIGVFLGAGYNVIGRPYFQRNSQLRVTALAMFLGWLVLALGATGSGIVPLSWPELSTSAWLTIIFLGTVAGAFPIYIYSWALGHASPTQVAVGIGMNPIIAILLGSLLLAEIPAWPTLTGLVAVLCGIVLANRRSPSV